MAGVVFEGGALRGIFSAGVMDALLENDIHFEYVIGVSAGIAYGISYVSNQSRRNLEVLRKYRNDPRYISLRNFFRCGAFFDYNFIFDEIPNKLVILDRKATANFKGTAIGVVTDAQSGKPVYMSVKNMDKKLSVLCASSAIPFYSSPVFIDGKRYFDGGISDSIPIKKSESDGNTKNLIVLTQPKGYRKKQGMSTKLVAFLLHRQFPNMSKQLLRRTKMYNDTLEYIEHLEKSNHQNTVVLRPSRKIKSFESNVQILEQSYNHGYDTTVRNIDKIRKLFED